MAYKVKFKQFYMDKTIALNGTSIYSYNGTEQDVYDILDHSHSLTIIYTDKDFYRIQKLLSCHGWEIIVKETSKTKEK